MSTPVDKTEDPWNDKTKEKFNRYVLASCAKVDLQELTTMALCSKSKSEWLDPCQEAAARSIKCLNRNGGDRAMCQDYFTYVASDTSSSGEKNGNLYGFADNYRRAYRECKKNWVWQIRIRRRYLILS